MPDLGETLEHLPAPQRAIQTAPVREEMMTNGLTFEAYQERRHIPALDGLRAFAVLGVLMHHSVTSRSGCFMASGACWSFSCCRVS
jgi:hypothetical protein